MSRPTTTNYALQKSLDSDPERSSGLAEHWGPVMDANLDAIDTAIAANAAAAAAASTSSLQDTVTARATDTSAPITQKTGTVILTKGSAGAWTLAAPTAATDDGKILTIIAGSAFAHTVITPANKLNGSHTTVTFAAVGDSVVLEAYNGVWYTRALNAAVVS
jgi:hypothetical protein